jgi:hypothetical protein
MRMLLTGATAPRALSLASCGGAAEDLPAGTRAKEPSRATKPAKRPPRLHCPRAATNCESARGTVVYVEAVDPDGDGDAHFVLAGDDSITLPGITVIDVEKDLRPRHLPGVGDTVSAEGPVYRGSYGQRQIQAERLRVSGYH